VDDKEKDILDDEVRSTIKALANHEEQDIERHRSKYARYVLVGIDLHDLVFLNTISAHLAEISHAASAFDRSKESGYFGALADISMGLSRDVYYIQAAMEAARKYRKLVPMLFVLSQEHRIWDRTLLASRLDTNISSLSRVGNLSEKLGLITVIRSGRRRFYRTTRLGDVVLKEAQRQGWDLSEYTT